MVARGNEAVYGVNLTEVARLADMTYDATPTLSPELLLRRAQEVLDTALALAEQLEPWLEERLPGRDRSVLSLVNHIVAIGGSYTRVVAGEAFSGDLAGAEVEPPLPLAAIRGARAQLRDSFGNCDDPARTVATYFGEQSLHAVLERVTWHMAQHTRQLQMVLIGHGKTPTRGVTPALLDGLPVPAGEWD